MTLWPWPLTFWPWECVMYSHYSASRVWSTYQFYYAMTIGYWVTITEYLITFPLSETVTAHDLCIGGPLKPHIAIFWPRIVYSLYNFYAATMTIKGSLYWSIPMLKQFPVAKKVQSKSVTEMAVFRKFKGPNIKYCHRDPQKADVIWRILRKYPSRGVGCSLI